MALQWPALVMLMPFRDRWALTSISLSSCPRDSFRSRTIGPHVRRHSSRPEHFVPVDATETDSSLSTSSADDPAVATAVNGFTGGGQTNSGFVFVVLKPLSERDVIGATRSLSGCARNSITVAGARLYPAAGYRISAPAGAPALPNTNTPCWPITADELYDWAPKIETALQQLPQLTDVNSDQQQKGLETQSGYRSRYRSAAGADGQPDRQHAL